MVDGPLDTAVFCTYVTKVLAPTLVVGEVVVIDNLSAHKVKDIREAIEVKGGPAVLAAILAGLVADRILPVQAQDILADRQARTPATCSMKR